jgi:hypothetical protein
MSINVDGANMPAVKQSPERDKQAKMQNPPIQTLAIGFTKSVGNDKKLNDLSNQLQNIDEKTIRDFAKHLNSISNGKIISDDVVDNAIKGLKYDGKELPELPNDNTAFSALDTQIKNATQKMLALNSASLIVNPNAVLKNPDANMAILPIPILNSQEEMIETLFKDEKAFAEKSKLLLPKTSQEIFDKNYPILQQANLDNPNSSDIKNIATASNEDNAKINHELVDNIAMIYQMVTLRFLAQLGSVPNAVPSAVPNISPASVKAA